MAWLVRDTTVLASVEVADTFAARCRGLLGRDGIDGALVLRPARSVHTLGMRFAIDVAHCDGDLRVLHVTRMRPHRLGRPFRRAYVIIEAEAGAFERWGLRVGDELAVHGEASGPPATGPDPHRLHAVRTIHRRVKAWAKARPRLDPAVPEGVGPDGQDRAPLVGSSDRTVTRHGRSATTATRAPVRVPQRTLACPTAALSGRGSASLLSATPLGEGRGASTGSASRAPAGSPGPLPPDPPFPPRLRALRRVRLPVACW